VLSYLGEYLAKRFDDQVWEIQRLARFDDSFNLDGRTLVMLIDCQHNQLDPRYKSVIIDERSGIIASNKETKRLLNQWIEEQPLSLLTMRVLQKMRYQKIKGLVYVLGEIMLVPLTGSTQYSTTWLGMHHLVDKYCYSDYERYLHLKMNEYFERPVTLSIELRGRVFQQQFAIAQELQLIEYHFWKLGKIHFDELPQSKIYKHSFKNFEDLTTFKLQLYINTLKFELVKRTAKQYGGETVVETTLKKIFHEVKRITDYL
jgi:hypothetical protein